VDIKGHYPRRPDGDETRRVIQVENEKDGVMQALYGWITQHADSDMHHAMETDALLAWGELVRQLVRAKLSE
jgi:hypothetical protein